MKFIAPLEIASKIMTLIVEAEKELILVSPYVEIYDWNKMKKSLSKAVDKGIHINFIVRHNASNDLSPLLALNIKPILVRDLHAKVYINDKYAIVTSQNIIQYSDTNSIDVGYITENEKERVELLDFVNNYIKNVNAIAEKVNPIAINTELLVAKKTNIVRLEHISTRADIDLSEFEVEELHRIFSANFANSYIKNASYYLFCGDLLPFCHVMIHCRYIVKIRKSRSDCEMIFSKIEEISFNLYYKYDVELYTSHKTYYYLDFVPQGSFEINKLVNDYINITNSILGSDYIKTLTVQKNIPAW
jgi:hypothetical protein